MPGYLNKTLISPYIHTTGTHMHAKPKIMLTHELDHLIPVDSRSDIDTKISTGYFTGGKQIIEQDLSRTVGRACGEADH